MPAVIYQIRIIGVLTRSLLQGAPIMPTAGFGTPDIHTGHKLRPRRSVRRARPEHRPLGRGRGAPRVHPLPSLDDPDPCRLQAASVESSDSSAMTFEAVVGDTRRWICRSTTFGCPQACVIDREAGALCRSSWTNAFVR